MQILTPHFGLAKSETLQGGPGICRLSSSPGPSMQKKKGKSFRQDIVILLPKLRV